MKKSYLFLAAGGLLALGTAAWAATNRSNTEEPDYTILSKDGDIELREYAPIIVAQTNVMGERDEAMNRGFRIIADYIFGNNIASQKVAMTAPVTQQASEKIAMTAPVTQKSDGDSWQIRFVMPAEYTMDTLPVPVNPEVELIEIPARQVAVIRFSGRADSNDLAQHRAKLNDWLASTGRTANGEPTFAFYDAPWTPGMMRRNEVMLELAD